jgi:hypothetical protein
MSKIEVGQTVRFRIDNKRVFGVVRTEAVATATGPLVKVQLLPDFAHLLPTGWTDASVEELTVVKVCACAHLAYRPIWGDHKGELFTTGCDFSRMPSRTSKFLPGHDAKAKGFLIKAAGFAQTMENGKGALENARELGDKICMAVAKGIDNDRKKSAQQAQSKRPSRKPEPAPAKREDELTEIQQLHKELGVTEPMLRVLVRGALSELQGFRGWVSGPTGTTLALKSRGLTSWDRVTDLGYKVCGLPNMGEEHPEWVQCKDAEGSYEMHSPRYNNETFVRECKRCGQEVADD